MIKAKNQQICLEFQDSLILSVFISNSVTVTVVKWKYSAYICEMEIVSIPRDTEICTPWTTEQSVNFLLYVHVSCMYAEECNLGTK